MALFQVCARTDEQVCKFNILPKIIPHLLLRRPRDVDEVRADLDVRAIDDRHLGADFFNERNETRHLWIVCGHPYQRAPLKNDQAPLANECNVNTAWRQGATIRNPPQAVFEDPSVESIFVLLS
jgi:hypothetical protein